MKNAEETEKDFKKDERERTLLKIAFWWNSSVAFNSQNRVTGDCRHLEITFLKVVLCGQGRERHLSVVLGSAGPACLGRVWTLFGDAY